MAVHCRPAFRPLRDYRVMNNMLRDDITNIWTSVLSERGMPQFCTGVVELEFENFKSLLRGQPNDDIRKLVIELASGKVLFLKRALAKEVCSLIVARTKEFFECRAQSFHKMIDGAPNFHRVIDETVASNYAFYALKHSAYFFNWNNDDLGLREEIYQVWRPIKRFIGLGPRQYEKSIPSKGVVDRIQVCLYPKGKGVLETHVDPYHNQLTFISGYLSCRGYSGDYQHGGFYVLDESGARVDMETGIEVGDFAIGLATVKHGVSLIDPGSFSGWNRDGLWFLGLYSNDSDMVKARRTASAAV